MKRKNALQLIGSFHIGGSERQALQLTRLLKADDWSVCLATLNRNGYLLGEAEDLGFNDIPEFPLTSFYDLNFVTQVRRFARHLVDRNIDVVQTHDFYTNVFGIAGMRLAGIKGKIASKRETLGIRSSTQRFIEQRMFGMADAIVANAQAVKTHLVNRGVRAEKIEVVYNGLDLDRLKPRSTDRNAILASLGLPVIENIKFITLVANLRHDVKNLPMLLRSAAIVAKNFPDAHFVLAGEGELRKGLEAHSKELKIERRVHFIGKCATVPELLSVSFAGVLTSNYEGFSNAILEYMAAGLPVVATDVGGAAEAIVENETGFLVRANDHEALADRLMALLRSEENSRKLGENGRKLAEEKFSLQTQLDKTTALYNKVLNR